MTSLIQQARDIAADQYIRMQVKNPTPFQGAALWGKHIEDYSRSMREGHFDANLEVQTALAALRGVA